MRSDLVPVLRALDELGESHARLAKSHDDFQAAAFKLASLFESLSREVKKAEALARAPGAATPLLLATRQLLDVHANLGREYLQLQQKMQVENRVFTSVSNVLKTRHDTAKNSISNTR